jgi:hypothetical protein
MEWRKADLGDSGRARNWMQSELGLALERRQEGAEIGRKHGGQVVVGGNGRMHLGSVGKCLGVVQKRAESGQVRQAQIVQNKGD